MKWRHLLMLVLAIRIHNKFLYAILLREIRLFFVCLSFLSRIPSPRWIGFQEEWLHKSIKYSPTVGIMLGTLQWFVYIIFQLFLVPVLHL